MSVGNLLRKVAPRGVLLDEVMSGWHEFAPGVGPTGRHRMEFRIQWGPDDLGQLVERGGPPGMTAPLSGEVDVEGLCESARCTGSITVDYLRSRTIRYDFRFAVGDEEYRYTGQKVNIRPWNLATSHTTCFGTVTSVTDGRLVSRSVTHFRLGTTWQFLRSLRRA